MDPQWTNIFGGGEPTEARKESYKITALLFLLGDKIKYCFI